MKSFFITTIFSITLFLTSQISYPQQLDWRFGFEYFELPPPITSEANHDSLISRINYVSVAQGTAGINVDGNGWQAMQPNQSSAIDFNEMDGWVKRFGDAGDELVFYLTPNTAWSHMSNTSCMNGTGDDECGPDAQHEQDWINYVEAIVERYDGDGVNDLPGMTVPVHYYVLPQEVTFSGQGGGDADDAAGTGYWDDNMQHLIRLHKITYDAIHTADPSGNSRLVGSGGWFIDLYSDFPDYPAIEGTTVHARLNGQNLYGSTYQAGFDSMKVLLAGLADTTGGKKCDYIGWHPHSGWQCTDQSFRFVHTYAPGITIFIDDMWCPILTGYNGLFFTIKDGYTQFIGGDSVNGDFPTSAITSFQQLFTGLDNGDAAITDWYNAKTSRETVKCFATAFGEGAERASFSLTNDVNPDNIAYIISQPFRYTGMVERKNNGFAPKPAMYTMRLLSDELFDFTSVAVINVSSNPKTRVYKFQRARGTACYVAWSETGWNTETPEIPNGETVSIPVISDTLTLTHIITQPGVNQPTTQQIFSSGGNITLQLGFEPVIIEEQSSGTGIATVSQNVSMNLKVFPNPASQLAACSWQLAKPGDVTVSIFDLMGRKLQRDFYEDESRGIHSTQIDLSKLPKGLFTIVVESDHQSEHVLFEHQ